MRKVVWAFRRHRADRVVAEVNNGADFVESLLRTVDGSVPYRKVVATRGKAVRAEPVSALYEQGRVHHVGVFAELEEQMCTWTPLDRGSPDRVDALVWAVTSLRGLTAGSWLDAYGVVVCEGCGHRFSSMAGQCPRCGGRREPAPPAAAAAGAVGVPGEWAAAYGVVRCGRGHAYSSRRHRECPHCQPGRPLTRALPGLGLRGAR